MATAIQLPSGASVDALVGRLAAAGPSYRKRVERTLRRVQTVLKAPTPFNRLAGNLEEVRAGERALRLELALLDGLKDGTLQRVDRPDGSKQWTVGVDTVKCWFSEKEFT